MKKVVSIMLVLVLILSMASIETFAMGKIKGVPPGLAKKGHLPHGVVKKFVDTDGYEWAEKAIEKMAIKGVIKGYGKGKFAPNKPVTKLEAIVMALRVMGYEDEAKLDLEKVKKGNKKLKYKHFVQTWAYGYISLALEKGILDEIDLLDFNLKEPAKRYEVAKYIIRALGLEEEAQKYMNEDLRFIDKGAIPLGTVGYIYLSDKMGIIQGYPNGTFLPNKPVTRAEMAVLIERLDDKTKSEIDNNEKYAEIINIDDDKLILKINDKMKIYNISEDVPVYTLEGKYVSIDELAVGMKIKIYLNDEKSIIFIEIKEKEDADTVIENVYGKNDLIIDFDDIKVIFDDDEHNKHDGDHNGDDND
ncbi:S-layer homology domain-containing protein [Caminicella sporogenes]|uniref:S-layer homology domain-containing protein n=1 Tax=Caminicella sporogenes TaxID=166485 RepID=UPI002540E12C|nr:S-layer homology domain-containing protein [Caminicella sporogenes]WIF95737.1 S-layer homology domain-containing protein [Caminicella sporogenes]